MLSYIEYCLIFVIILIAIILGIYLYNNVLEKKSNLTDILKYSEDINKNILELITSLEDINKIIKDDIIKKFIKDSNQYYINNNNNIDNIKSLLDTLKNSALTKSQLDDLITRVNNILTSNRGTLPSGTPDFIASTVTQIQNNISDNTSQYIISQNNLLDYIKNIYDTHIKTPLSQNITNFYAPISGLQTTRSEQLTAIDNLINNINIAKTNIANTLSKLNSFMNLLADPTTLPIPRSNHEKITIPFIYGETYNTSPKSLICNDSNDYIDGIKVYATDSQPIKGIEFQCKNGQKLLVGTDNEGTPRNNLKGPFSRLPIMYDVNSQIRAGYTNSNITSNTNGRIWNIMKDLGTGINTAVNTNNIKIRSSQLSCPVDQVLIGINAWNDPNSVTALQPICSKIIPPSLYDPLNTFRYQEIYQPPPRTSTSSYSLPLSANSLNIGNWNYLECNAAADDQLETIRLNYYNGSSVSHIPYIEFICRYPKVDGSLNGMVLGNSNNGNIKNQILDIPKNSLNDIHNLYTHSNSQGIVNIINADGWGLPMSIKPNPDTGVTLACPAGNNIVGVDALFNTVLNDSKGGLANIRLRCAPGKYYI
jgi:hypothetical protein